MHALSETSGYDTDKNPFVLFPIVNLFCNTNLTSNLLHGMNKSTSFLFGENWFPMVRIHKKLLHFFISLQKHATS